MQAPLISTSPAPAPAKSPGIAAIVTGVVIAEAPPPAFWGYGGGEQRRCRSSTAPECLAFPFLPLAVLIELTRSWSFLAGLWDCLEAPEVCLCGCLCPCWVRFDSLLLYVYLDFHQFSSIVPLRFPRYYSGIRKYATKLKAQPGADLRLLHVLRPRVPNDG